MTTKRAREKVADNAQTSLLFWECARQTCRVLRRSSDPSTCRRRHPHGDTQGNDERAILSLLAFPFLSSLSPSLLLSHPDSSPTDARFGHVLEASAVGQAQSTEKEQRLGPQATRQQHLDGTSKSVGTGITRGCGSITDNTRLASRIVGRGHGRQTTGTASVTGHTPRVERGEDLERELTPALPATGDNAARGLGSVRRELECHMHTHTELQSGVLAVLSHCLPLALLLRSKLHFLARNSKVFLARHDARRRIRAVVQAWRRIARIGVSPFASPAGDPATPLRIGVHSLPPVGGFPHWHSFSPGSLVKAHILA